MNTQSIEIVGIPWYSAEQYAEIKALMKDGHELPRTHAEWQRFAEQAEEHVRRQGKLVVRAHLEPEAFRHFCLRHGLDVDAQGRMKFASWAAAQPGAQGH